MDGETVEVPCRVLDVEDDCYRFETVRVLVGVTLVDARGCSAPPHGIIEGTRKRWSRLLRRGEVPVPTEYAFPPGIVDAIPASTSQKTCSSDESSSSFQHAAAELFRFPRNVKFPAHGVARGRPSQAVRSVSDVECGVTRCTRRGAVCGRRLVLVRTRAAAHRFPGRRVAYRDRGQV